MTEEEIIKVATKTAIEVYEQRIEREQEVRRKRARDNTKKLLRGYNELKEHCEHAIANTEDSVPSDLQLILTEVFDRKGLLKVEAIAASKRRTELIIEHIDCMLDVYRKQCAHRSSDKFHALMAYYVHGEDVKTIAHDLAVKKGFDSLDERTVYRYLEQAENDVSLLLWGLQAV